MMWTACCFSLIGSICYFPLAASTAILLALTLTACWCFNVAPVLSIIPTFLQQLARSRGAVESPGGRGDNDRRRGRWRYGDVCSELNAV